MVIPNPELQSYFGTPFPCARLFCRLTYLKALTIRILARSSLGNGGSVRFQTLSRSLPLNCNLVIDDENIPFAESARAARPAEWGVIKLGNISRPKRAFYRHL